MSNGSSIIERLDKVLASARQVEIENRLALLGMIDMMIQSRISSGELDQELPDSISRVMKKLLWPDARIRTRPLAFDREASKAKVAAAYNKSRDAIYAMRTKELFELYAKLHKPGAVYAEILRAIPPRSHPRYVQQTNLAAQPDEK